MNHQEVVYLIDDHEEALAALQALLQAHHYTTQAYQNPHQFFNEFDKQQPGCLITDYKMAQMDGLEVLKRIRKLKNDLPVIVISAYATVSTTVSLMRSGALTLLQKPYDDTQLLSAVEEAFTQQRRKNRQHELQGKSDQISKLNAEELQILEKLIEGQPNKAIAMSMNISPRTVDRRKVSIFRKLNAKSLAEVALIYVDWVSHNNMTDSSI